MSSDLAIWCEGLGKRYLVPHRQQQTIGFVEDLRDHFKEFTGLVGRDDEQDYFWALRDVSFEVKQGEILGIVGKNGSGKSTLLKILSGVTEPTTGRARMRGRIGSLLEVGTGFNPDMTGRENVFMSGALLGLSQADIRKEFDEIVDFSGIGRFIDVPVKRYSSGMYVRLAFSVASLLRSDILILDEVLAVGDAAFKEKSEKIINRIANDGRTVILVSHNMHAIRHMCQRGIVLNKGRLIADESPDEAVRSYNRVVRDEGELKIDVRSLPAKVNISEIDDPDEPRQNKTLLWIETVGASGPTRLFETGHPFHVRVGYDIKSAVESFYFSVFIVDSDDARIMVSYSYHDAGKTAFDRSGVIECSHENLLLLDGHYRIDLDFGVIRDGTPVSMDWVYRTTQFVVEQGDYFAGLPLLPNQGAYAQRCTWKNKIISEHPSC